MTVIVDLQADAGADLQVAKSACSDRLRGVSLRQLRAFALVARHLSFGRAARELHLSPSAISLQIKELESLLGLALFARSARGVSLSHAGSVLLGDVNRALLALRDAGEAVDRLRGEDSGVVAVGMVSNAKYFVPRLLADFHAEHPAVDLRMRVGNREQLLRQLYLGEVDIAVMGTPPRELELCAEAFATQHLGIVAAPSHPLARQSAIPVARLAREEFIVREPGSGTRAAMEAFLAGAGITPVRLIEMNGNETIKQAVMAGMGVAFLSLNTTCLEIQQSLLVSLDVEGLPLRRPWHIVSARNGALTDVARALRQYVVERGAAAIGDPIPARASGIPVAATG